jgi:hypothetical protein
VENAGLYALLDELVVADQTQAVAIAEIDELGRRTEEVHAQADELGHLLAAAPAERERIGAVLSEAEEQERSRAESLALAERELDEAAAGRDKERLQEAKRRHLQASDALAMSTKLVASLRAEQDELARRVAEAKEATPRVEARASAIAAELRGLSHVAGPAAELPASGLEGVSAWATGARAALLVARNGLAAQREAVVRQASELGSAIVGEALVATSTETIARRVRASLDTGS